MNTQTPSQSTLLEQTIHYTFIDKNLMRKALTHPSHTKHNKEFERFEFLGDRVLGLCMANILIEYFPHETEGSLAKRHAALVSRESCQAIADAIHLKQYVRAICDQGVEQSNWNAILADAVEALLGAMFLDQGIEPCQRFIQHFWKELIQHTKEPPRDAKSTLQEWLQKRKRAVPAYHIDGCEGPAHSPIFKCTLNLDGMPIFHGSGSSRRLAEQDTAKEAMAYITKHIK